MPEVGKSLSLHWHQLEWDSDAGKSLALVWNTLPVPAPMLNDGFILDLDLAMKRKVSGLRVTDQRVGADRRLVRAFFRMPTGEITDQTYPYITIDLLGFSRAADREQRSSGLYLPYTPKGYTPPADGQEHLHTDEAPIPYDFVWQITAHSRWSVHDREISFALIQNDRFPPRGAYLAVGEEGEVQTLRQMFVLDGPLNQDSVDSDGKRHFRKVWRVQASGELFQKDIVALTKPTTIITEIYGSDEVRVPVGASTSVQWDTLAS